MLGYGRDESAPTPGGVFAPHFVGVRNVIEIRLQRNGMLLAAVGADLSCPCIRARHTFVKRWGHICNPFETHLCNVRNVLVICVLHIRRVKVWFLRCKSMGFSMQKPHFWLAKTTFLNI